MYVTVCRLQSRQQNEMRNIFLVFFPHFLSLREIAMSKKTDSTAHCCQCGVFFAENA